MKKHTVGFLVLISVLFMFCPVWGKEKNKKMIFDASDNLLFYYMYMYNEFGKDKKSHYNASDKLLSYYGYEYDEEGRRTRKNEFDPDHNLIRYTVYIYMGLMAKGFKRPCTTQKIKFRPTGHMNTTVPGKNTNETITHRIKS